MPDRHIFLVGPMGVGKSTIGRLLAAELHLPFHDTDRVIEKRTGADIPWIFDVEGEDGFRRRETAVLRELAGAQSATVIATGGGIITREENCQLMREAGFVCYLTASVAQLVARTSRDKKRPLLQVDDPRQRIIDILNERAPLYQAAATMVINTDRCSPRSAVASIVAQL